MSKVNVEELKASEAYKLKLYELENEIKYSGLIFLIGISVI